VLDQKFALILVFIRSESTKDIVPYGRTELKAFVLEMLLLQRTAIQISQET